MNTTLTESVLTESRSARDSRLHAFSNDQASARLQAQGLVMALWKGDRVATTAQMAEFYQVAEEAVRQTVKRHREEFDADGLKVLRGKALNELSDTMSLSPGTPHLALWTPRAALRLGMLLRDSEVAKAVRTALLDVAEAVPELASENERLRLALEIERERNRGKELDHTMLTLHGKDVVLALRGKKDQIVKSETTVVEVVDMASGTAQRILSADELRRQVQRRTGQKLKSMKVFTDALRAAGRDDLLVPVKRQTVGEYVSPDALDEAIAVVYGDNRQQLIGE